MTRSISIRFSLLSYSLTMLAFVACVLIGIQYYYNHSLSLAAADNTFNHIADKISIFTRSRDKQLAAILDLNSIHPNLGHQPVPGEPHPAFPLLKKILQGNQDIYSIYIGLENGSFYEVINLYQKPELKLSNQAPELATMAIKVVVEEEGKRYRYLDFLDQNETIIASRKELSKYDPRLRPWYIKASKRDQVYRTDPYMFAFIDSSGVSYARKLTNANGVMALDITMDKMNAFLASQKFGDGSEIFIYNRNGEKLASSSLVNQTVATALPDVGVTTSSKIDLTPQEQDFIRQYPEVRVSNQNDWAPYDFNQQGQPQGYSIDLLKLVSQKTGLRFKYLNGFTSSELLDLYAKGNIDVLLSAHHQPDDLAANLFTEPLFKLETQLITRQNSSIHTLSDLKGKTVAIIEDKRLVQYLNDQVPGVRIKQFGRTIDAYSEVLSGNADVTIDNLNSLHYIQQKHGLNELKMVMALEEFDHNNAQYSMMVSFDKPILQSILNKALRAIPHNEIEDLKNYWLGKPCSLPDDCMQMQKSRDNIAPAPFLQVTRRKPEQLVSFEQEGESFFAFSTALTLSAGNAEKLGLFIPQASLTKSYMKTVTISLLTAVATVIIMVPLALSFTSVIMRPVSRLMQENEKIRDRLFHKVQPVHSWAKELGDLSDSLMDMSASIQSYERSQEELMESFVQIIAGAIDAKSPYTGGHCHRVPELAIMLATAANDENSAKFKDFHFDTDEQWREFRFGAYLHDCGKVVTPEYVVDKATKLETLYNRIHEVRTRFELLWRDAEISCLKRQLEGEDKNTLQKWLKQEQQQLIDDFNFIAECNIGGEFMSDDKKQRVEKIARKTWLRHFDNRVGISFDEHSRLAGQPVVELPAKEYLLCDRIDHIIERKNFDYESYKKKGFKLDVPEHLYNNGEVHNLCIERGTLTEEERFKINEHIIMTITMLERLPLPDNLKRLPEYAGTHHEMINGKGYPRKLKYEELSMPARIMAVADVFEALTASDRPYKKAKKLSEALKIMQFMCKDNHLDKDVFELFLHSGVYLQYANMFLDEHQLDQVNIEDYL